MAKYRKKPVVVDAALFKGWRDIKWGKGSWSKEKPLLDFGTSAIIHATCNKCGKYLARHAKLWVEANTAWVNICPGEWIIKDSKGFYPCKPDIFEQTYEAVEESKS